MKPIGASKKSFTDLPANPHRLAAELLESGGPGGQPYWLRYWQDTFFEWAGSHYRKVPDTLLKATICSFARKQFQRLAKLQEAANKQSDEENPKPPTTLEVNTQLVNNVLLALRGLCVIPPDTGAPAWLDGASGPDPRFLLAGPNGVYNLAAAAAGQESNVLLPLDPDLFNLTAVKYHVAATGEPPYQWAEFLEQLWPDDQEAVDALQEWAGYVLSGDTSRQKMLWLIGPSRAGKGVITSLLTQLVGAENVCTPGLHDLASDFGLSSLLGKSLAIVGDGRLSNRTDAVQVTARLLQIVGEDGIDVNRKGKAIIENARLNCRVVIAANALPALVDQAEAILNRSLILRFTKTFAGKEDTALKKKLAPNCRASCDGQLRAWHAFRRKNGSPSRRPRRT